MTPPDPGRHRPVTRREALLAGVVPLLAAVAGCDAQDPDGTTVEAPAPAVRPPAGPVRSGLVAFGDFGGGPAQAAVAGAMERWGPRAGSTRW